MTLPCEEIADLSLLTGRVLDIAKGLPEGRPLWFRGLPCHHHKLVPKLFRDARDSTSALDRERRLIVRFRQRSLPFWPGGYPQSEWEHLFVMQHHGVPTRLLDWSENLFVALFFAVSDRPQHAAGASPHPDCECAPTLWCMDPIGWNETIPQLNGLVDKGSIYTTADEEIIRPYSPATNENRLLQRNDRPLAIYGTHNSERIVAQRGTFTIAGRAMNAMDDVTGTNALWKFKIGIPNEDLRKSLVTLGFRESMIYPDLMALARELSEVER